MREQNGKPSGLEQKITGVYKTIEEKFTDTFLDEEGGLKTGGMAEKAVSAYQKIEDTVVGGYQKIENSVVGGYKKIEGAFVEAFLEQEEDGADEAP